MKGIGARLRQIRKELGINQGEFSKRIEIAQGTYSAIENEKEILTPRNIKLICLEFGVNMDWLQNGGAGPIFRKLEYTPAEKELLDLFDKLDPDYQKQVQDYANERLALQKHKKDADRAFDEGYAGKKRQK